MKAATTMAHSFFSRFIGNTSGTSIVEYVIILPVFLSFILGSVDFGMLMFGRISLEYATTQTVRYAYVHKTFTSTQIKDYAMSLSSKKTDKAVFSYDVDIDPGVATTITGSLTYTYFFETVP